MLLVYVWGFYLYWISKSPRHQREPTEPSCLEHSEVPPTEPSCLEHSEVPRISSTENSRLRRGTHHHSHIAWILTKGKLYFKKYSQFRYEFTDVTYIYFKTCCPQLTFVCWTATAHTAWWLCGPQKDRGTHTHVSCWLPTARLLIYTPLPSVSSHMWSARLRANTIYQRPHYSPVCDISLCHGFKIELVKWEWSKRAVERKSN